TCCTRTAHQLRIRSGRVWRALESELDQNPLAHAKALVHFENLQPDTDLVRRHTGRELERLQHPRAEIARQHLEVRVAHARREMVSCLEGVVDVHADQSLAIAPQVVLVLDEAAILELRSVTGIMPVANR